MALDKSRTSLGVKIVLVMVAVSMVAYLVPTLFGLFSSTGSSADSASGTTDASAQIAQKYTARVAANDERLRSDPATYAVLVDQGNAYFDWGMDVVQAAESNQALRGADAPMWVAAKQFYERALAVDSKDPNVNVDFAIATFYSGDPAKAVVIATDVTKKQPDFAPAWFNLGVFYAGLNEPAKAYAAFQKSIDLDPEGKNTNIAYAKEQLEALKGSASATSSVTATSSGTATGSVTATP